MKRTVALLVFALAFLLGVGGSGSGSGLRGTVLISPGSPTCKAGTACTRPAPNTPLRFWRNGRLVAHTRTDGQGRFRIALRPRTYRVTSTPGAALKPSQVTVTRGAYRRMAFKLDIGIR